MDLLLIFLMSINNKSIEVHFTDDAPKIDGLLEEIWFAADSADNFVQYMPYEKELPTEKTIVYVLQDKENIYFAFRCWAKNHKPVTQLGANADYVVVYLDPFDSKTTAYYFKVYASGVFDDGWILDDGRSSDDAWDGVWSRAVRVYDNRYEIEVKIPFKSIRYKNGLPEWRINFKRSIIAKQESNYWTQVLQIEGNMVSKYGTLKGINPQTTGYYFEFYPEGFVSYDKYTAEAGQIKPSGSLNFKWDITPQTTLNATAYPDFAQIESDPFTLNLSRYETLLDERRPFFLEGKEIFRMSDFGEGKGFYSPLDLFYSRRIGKSINAEPVPILGGLKLTNKSENWNFGGLVACTDSLNTEPNRWFGILRTKRSVLRNSYLGFLFSSALANRQNYNYALGFDCAYRSGVNQMILQGAVSDKNGKKGFAGSTGYFGFVNGFLVMGGAAFIQDSFDVSDIGHVPWVGMKKIMLISGPYKMYAEGFLNSMFAGPGITIIKEPGNNSNWSKLGMLIINPSFRNEWGVNLELTGGQYFENNLDYFYRGMNLSIWGSGTKYDINFGGNYYYSYNYNRGFLAYQGWNWFSFEYDLLPRISPSLSSNVWIEWDTLNALTAVTSMATPRIALALAEDMNFEIFNEFVLITQGVDFGATEMISNRLGFLFSWNFKPKSWFYVAFNDYRVENEQGNLTLQNRIGAIKVKYLIYF